MSEVALDFGRIHSCKAEEDIREVELELKEVTPPRCTGSPRHCMRVCR